MVNGGSPLARIGWVYASGQLVLLDGGPVDEYEAEQPEDVGVVAGRVDPAE